MSVARGQIAVIFDFDDTLAPDTSSAFLQEYGIDPLEFWTDEVAKRVTAGFDPTLAFLQSLLDKVGDGKPLAGLTNKDLRKSGKK